MARAAYVLNFRGGFDWDSGELAPGPRSRIAFLCAEVDPNSNRCSVIGPERGSPQISGRSADDRRTLSGRSTDAQGPTWAVWWLAVKGGEG